MPLLDLIPFIQKAKAHRISYFRRGEACSTVRIVDNWKSIVLATDFVRFVNRIIRFGYARMGIIIVVIVGKSAIIMRIRQKI